MKTLAELRKMLTDADGALGVVRTRMRTDIKFASGVDDQWTEEDTQARGPSRARMQFPIFSAYISKIVGAYNANPFAIKLEGEEQSDAVERLNEKIVEIEDESNAKNIYSSALRNALSCGYGFIYATTEKDEKGEPCVRIEAVPNPLSIFFDPNSTKVDGSDGEYFIHREDITRDKAKRLFGEEATESSENDGVFYNTNTDTSVPVLTFWYKEKKNSVAVVKVVGNKIIDEQTLPIRRLPIVLVAGEAVLKADSGAVEYTGIVHKAIDAQRLLNYAVSLSGERLALSPKANYLVVADSIKAHTKLWKQANKINPPALPYDLYDEKGRTLAPPTKQDTAINVGDIGGLTSLYTDAVAQIIGIPIEGIVENHSVQTAEEVITKAKASESILSCYYENLASSIKALGAALIELISYVYKYDAPKDGATRISVSAGPLLSTMRKEKLRSFYAMATALPEYKAILAPRMLECMDGADEELVEQAKAISAMQLTKEQAALQQAQTAPPAGGEGVEGTGANVEDLLQQKAQLEGLVQRLTAELEAVKNSVNGEVLKAQNAVLMEDLKHRHAMELEAMKQAGANTRQANELQAEAEREVFRAEQEQAQTIEEMAPPPIPPVEGV
jgi:hypothetical protein